MPKPPAEVPEAINIWVAPIGTRIPAMVSEVLSPEYVHVGMIDRSRFLAEVEPLHSGGGAFDVVWTWLPPGRSLAAGEHYVMLFDYLDAEDNMAVRGVFADVRVDTVRGKTAQLYACRKPAWRYAPVPPSEDGSELAAAGPADSSGDLPAAAVSLTLDDDGAGRVELPVFCELNGERVTVGHLSLKTAPLVLASTEPEPEPEPAQLSRVPYLGASVVYVSYGTPKGEYGPDCRAAIVTAAGGWVTVDDTSSGDPNTPGTPTLDGAERTRTLTQRWSNNAASLLVMNPGGLFLNPERPVEYHTGRDTDGTFIGWCGGTWHYPDDEIGTR